MLGRPTSAAQLARPVRRLRQETAVRRRDVSTVNRALPDSPMRGRGRADVYSSAKNRTMSSATGFGTSTGAKWPPRSNT
ncbi:hypothetical protein UA74_06780 [Actinoalloteichus fjordicus]|uniref:Uncharacterized protein n=1 Tax=Actinoalloteichus fjordicus TaxID=1612552 RepID=A0AAC9LB46_9PSEU|nr:hypothetical protein UA74_06780 [Actinoalloteichus fjordicus]